MQFDSEKADKITGGACACNDDKVIFENPLIYSAAVFRVPGMNWDSRVWDGTCPAPGGLSKKLHAKAAAEKQQSITLVNQSFDERKIVVLRSDGSPRSKTSPTITSGYVTTRELENFLNASRFGRTESHASENSDFVLANFPRDREALVV